MRKGKRGYDRGKAARRLARDRVGTVPASRPIEPKLRKKRPKHKKSLLGEEGTGL
ncbi:MAG TPA: hypothetical protein VLH09_04655 [Bryobacteraceae bacterium]|nr:hypothetical protein [Bryobacteraceae bacterium]